MDAEIARLEGVCTHAIGPLSGAIVLNADGLAALLSLCESALTKDTPDWRERYGVYLAQDKADPSALNLAVCLRSP